MAMNFGSRGEAAKGVTLTLHKTEEEEIQPFDIQTDREKARNALAHSPEIEALTSQLDVNDLTTIVSFGKESAEQISRASDTVLHSMSLNQINESGKLLNTLARVMSQFDIVEIRESPSLLGKLFGGMRKQLDRILEKYNGMGDEVDQIYVQLKQYEREIIQTNNKLEEMFQSNINYYHELVKYIVAGEQGCREISDYMAKLQQEMQESGDESIQFELQSLQQALMMLEQRTQDLRTAEIVAMQSIPMLRAMEVSNMNLVRKINSAFIITLPVFKQALAQAVMLKRQKIQAEAISALDERTNELLMKNARNTVEQSKIAARMSSGTSIKAETLESTWKTIVEGIEETRRIQDNALKQRADDQARLERIKKEFNEKVNASGRR